MSQSTKPISDPAIAPHPRHAAAEDVLELVHDPHAPNPNSELHGAAGVQIHDDSTADRKSGDARTASSSPTSSELFMSPASPTIAAANPNPEPHSTTTELLQSAVNTNLLRHESELLHRDTDRRSSELQDHDAPIDELDAVSEAADSQYTNYVHKSDHLQHLDAPSNPNNSELDHTVFLQVDQIGHHKSELDDADPVTNYVPKSDQLDAATNYNPNSDQQVDNYINPKSELDAATNYSPNSEQIDNTNPKSDQLDGAVPNYSPTCEPQVDDTNPNSELDVVTNDSPISELQVDSINPKSELDAVASNYSAPNSDQLQLDHVNPINSELHAVTKYYSPNSDLQVDHINPNSDLDAITDYDPISEQGDNFNPNSELHDVTNYNPISELHDVTNYNPISEHAGTFNPNSDVTNYNPIISEQADNLNPNSVLDTVAKIYNPIPEQADSINPNSELDAVTYSPNISERADNFDLTSERINPNSEQADNINPNSELDAVTTIPDSQQVAACSPNPDLQLDAVSTNYPNPELDANVTADPNIAELDHSVTVAIGHKSELQIQHDAAHTNPDPDLDTDQLRVDLDHHQPELQLLHDADDDHTNPNSELNTTDQTEAREISDHHHKLSALDAADLASPNCSELDTTQSQADYRAASERSGELQYIDGIAEIDQLHELYSARIDEYTDRQLDHRTDDFRQITDDEPVVLIAESEYQCCSTDHRLEYIDVVADGAAAAAGCESSDDYQLINVVANDMGAMDISYGSSELIAESPQQLADHQYSDVIAGTDEDQHLLHYSACYNSIKSEEEDSEEEDGDGAEDGDGDGDGDEEELESENRNLVAAPCHIDEDEINLMELIIDQRHVGELAASDDDRSPTIRSGAKHSKINGAHRDIDAILWSHDHDQDQDQDQDQDHHQIPQAEQRFIGSSSTNPHREIAIIDDASDGVDQIKHVVDESELLRLARFGSFRKISETPTDAHNLSGDGPALPQPMDDDDGRAPDIKEQGHECRDKAKGGAAQFRVKLPPLMVLTGIAIAAVGVAIASICRNH